MRVREIECKSDECVSERLNVREIVRLVCVCAIVCVSESLNVRVCNFRV
jgi:hypothetical protein